MRRRRARLRNIGDPVASAEAASLRYVSDRQPGIRRKRAGRGFTYLGVDGTPIRDPGGRRRLQALAIPPAWTDVWICPNPRGHIQATGRDARGRKQYRYHTRWRAVRDDSKYGRLIAFGEALPRIRAMTAQHLALPRLTREKVLATVVRLLESTAIRVGNAEYARENNSFGLTTLRSRHAEVSGATVRFQFRGKGGKLHQVDVSDRRLARVVRRCQELAGQELFPYRDDQGQTRSIDSDDVNAYLGKITGQDFTAKDFRTWAGTVLACLALRELEPFTSQRQAKRHLLRAVESVAARLGNTPAICRKSYVHPAVIDAYVEGTLLESLEPAESMEKLPPEEAAVMGLLQQRAREQDRKAA